MHVSLLFLTWGIVAFVSPSLTSVSSLALAGVLAALGYLMIERVVRPHEPAICARLGVVDVGYAPVVRGWSWAIVGLTACLAIFVVVSEMIRTVLGQGPIVFTLAHTDWWIMLAVLTLLGVYLAVLASDPEDCGAIEPAHLLVGFNWLSVALIWWLGVACSPCMWVVSNAAVYFPLATAVAALATAQIGRQYAHPETWSELGWLGDLRSESLERMLAAHAFALSALAIVFTRGAIAPATVLTLVLSSLTLGLVTLAQGWQGAALVGSAAWTAACAVAGSVISSRLGWTAEGQRAICASAAALPAAFSLVWPGVACCCGGKDRPKVAPHGLPTWLKGPCQSSRGRLRQLRSYRRYLSSWRCSRPARIRCARSVGNGGGSRHNPGRGVVDHFAGGALAGGVAGLCCAVGHGVCLRRL